MPFEIDMLSVGNADAIIVQAYDNQQHITVLIDGGNSSNGDLVVEHINKWARGKVDLLISTHFDADHINGLSTVVEQLPVGQALIHNPAAHHRDLNALVNRLRQKELSEARMVVKSLTGAVSLISLLDRNGIRCEEPFTGVRYRLPDDGLLVVFGPTEAYYNQLMAQMEFAVENATIAKMIEDAQDYLRLAEKSYSSQTDREIIDEKDEESPSNNSSVLTGIVYGSDLYLFTADAGPIALQNALQEFPDNLRKLYWMQVPHHGSRRNLTSTLIDEFSPQVAFVSAIGGDDKKHPNASVVNVLKSTGCRVFGTNLGRNLWHSRGASLERTGYVDALPL